MKGIRFGIVVLAAAALGASASAGSAGAASLAVKSTDFKDGRAIPAVYAFCAPADQGHISGGQDKNPEISWSKGPKGTKSYALIVIDPDVPKDLSDINKEGKIIPVSAKRTKFYHWVLVDIPADTTEIAEGADSSGATAHGKPAGPATDGVRGINDFTGFFASDDKMKGNYGGYDGPCPPWNDQRPHHYHFVVVALDVPSLNLKGNFGGEEAERAMKGHMLAKGEIVGTYSLNTPVAAKLKK
jgi:Raf kinase inhibitor-like YbhB/YbcL family protein